MTTYESFEAEVRRLRGVPSNQRHLFAWQANFGRSPAAWPRAWQLMEWARVRELSCRILTRGGGFLHVLIGPPRSAIDRLADLAS